MHRNFIDFKLFNLKEHKAVLSLCKGANKKNIFIAFEEQEEAKLALLNNILKAIHLELEQDTLFLKGPKDLIGSFIKIQQQESIEKAIFFGYTPQQFGINVNYQLYQPFSINHCQYIFADSLHQIENNKELKSHLWKALQVLFDQ